MKFKIIFLKLFHPIKIFWDNFYWHKIKKVNTKIALRDNDKKQSFENCINYIKRISEIIIQSFEYKKDGLKELGDSTPPPPEMYRRYCNSNPWSDDCDGFHSCLYHWATMNNSSCYLLSIYSLKNSYGHCVLAYVDENAIWHVHDYTQDYYDISLEHIIVANYLS